jgi:hypothetical protein
MLRFFISPHPTFKSYKAPDKERVEKSPYYWWWYALTLNDEYLAVCDDADGAHKGGKLATSCEEEIRQVYTDFGDVRYEGDRYKAFCDWWRAPVSTGERRGEYLFAEPVHASTVKVLEGATDVERAMTSDDTIIVSIPLNRQRQHVNKAIDRLLKKHMQTEKGRAVRNPSHSKARYSLSKPSVPNALKKSFELYTARRQSLFDDIKTSNGELAKLTNLNYTVSFNFDNENSDNAARNRTISVIVSRHIASAKKTIHNIKYGCFP